MPGLLSRGITVLLALGLLAARGPSVVVDRVIVVVDKQVLTETELLAEARVALVRQEGTRGIKLLEADLDADLLAALRTYVVNQVIVSSQVRRLGSAALSEAVVDKEVSGFALKFGSPAAYKAFLRKFDIREGTVRDILRRDLRNARYIDQRMPSWLATVREGGTQKERYARALEAWLAEVRHSLEIRMLGPMGELELQ